MPERAAEAAVGLPGPIALAAGFGLAAGERRDGGDGVAADERVLAGSSQLAHAAVRL